MKQRYNTAVGVIDIIKGEHGRHRVSVRNAVEGVKIAFRTQPNFAYHSFFSLCAIFFGMVFGIKRDEWLVIIMLIVLGMVVEMANTAFESVVDLVTDVWHKDAKVAKDVAAGMMLIFSFGATVLAAIVFFPYVVKFLETIYLQVG